MASLRQNLSSICPNGVFYDVPLAQVSRWQIGGIADVIVEPNSVQELCQLRSFISTENLPSLVIGDTSNLLFSDEGLRAICIRIGARMSRVDIEGCTVNAQAGVWVPRLARIVQKAGLTGAEHTCGIPGSLGGLICMNGGSQRKCIGSSVVSATAVDQFGKLEVFTQDSCVFSYRKSIFQFSKAVIVSALLHFAYATDKSDVRRVMLQILRSRNQKFPRKLPNCGSVFKSNPSMYSEIGPPGAVIESLGFKGYRIGDAVVSPDHANFFINAGKATARDMITLIRKVATAVESATGYRMDAEVRFVTPCGMIDEIL